MNIDYSTRESVTVRPPATANLMIDSADRDNNLFPTPWDFQISKKQSILNGYFTRIGTSEVVLEWFASNISGNLDNNDFEVDISGTGANTFAGIESITLFEGNYTVAQALDAIVNKLNDLSGTTGVTFSISQVAGVTELVSSGGKFTIVAGNLQEALDFTAGGPLVNEQALFEPDLRPYRYLDFVSEDLTYNQNLKDSDTTDKPKNVLCRWYFSTDDQTLDAYGFPVLMGYTQFCVRRLYNPPKQIRWDSIMPIGNLRFQVYDDNGNLLDSNDRSDWLMTLQVSEN